MRELQVQLLTDNRVSDAGRILGLYISRLELGEWHELRYEHLATLLQGFPSDDTIARHLRQLELAGYVERRTGGRGHSPSFRWREPGPIEDRPAGDRTYPIDPQETGPKTPDRSAPVRTHPIEPHQSGPIRAAAEVTHAGDPKPQDDDDEVGGEPPSVGFPHELHPKAEETIDRYDEQLTGCRGALRDYLQARVPSARQYAYVQTLACWFEGTQDVWRLPDGSRLKPGDRPPMLALALNDLAASDELRMTRPIGDPANLRTKLNVLLKQRGQDERSNGGGTDQRGTRAESGRGPRSGPGGKAGRRGGPAAANG